VFDKYKSNQPAAEIVFEPVLSKDQAEELKKKRLERFGPVDPADIEKRAEASH
jgi:hypothetical protein